VTGDGDRAPVAVGAATVRRHRPPRWVNRSRSV